MDLYALEQIRREFGGFSELIRDDAEAYISALLGTTNDACTSIFLGVSDGTHEVSRAAWKSVSDATRHLADLGFTLPDDARCPIQLGHGNDFVYACSIDMRVTEMDYRSILEAIGDLHFSSSFPFRWRIGVGSCVHTAYIALSHAKASQLWADNLIASVIEDSGVSLQSVEDFHWISATV